MFTLNALSKENWGLFLMFYSKYTLFQNQYLEFIESQIKSVGGYQDKVGTDERPEIKTKNTDCPICPSCGKLHSNYAEFGFRDREILQCTTCDNDFIIIRGSKDVYTTRKVIRDK